MSKLLPKFEKQIMPYPKNYFYGRGIVLTAGPEQIKYTKVNLRLIEISKTKLPLQIWYSSSQISQDQIIDLFRTAPNLNISICCFLKAECRTLKQIWQLNATYVFKPRTSSLPKHFPYKPAAILSSTFSEVLFLDCDSYVTRDPEELFLADPMYLKFGALFFPDGIISRQNIAVWNLFNTSCGDNEFEFDSGMILVDKRRVWNPLYLAKLMNDDHELFYQHATNGDKDTFRLAFRYLKIKYYLVMTPCSTGSFNGTHFCGYSLCKTDSLSQHIYVNHVNIFKYNPVKYSSMSLEYTRIGLGDPNNHTFYLRYCKLPKTTIKCFYIFNKTNRKMMDNECYHSNILFEEIDNHKYLLNEPLITKNSTTNRILFSKTNNLMLSFTDNFLQAAKGEFF